MLSREQYDQIGVLGSYSLDKSAEFQKEKIRGRMVEKSKKKFPLFPQQYRVPLFALQGGVQWAI